MRRVIDIEFYRTVRRSSLSKEYKMRCAFVPGIVSINTSIQSPSLLGFCESRTDDDLHGESFGRYRAPPKRLHEHHHRRRRRPLRTTQGSPTPSSDIPAYPLSTLQEYRLQRQREMEECVALAASLRREGGGAGARGQLTPNVAHLFQGAVEQRGSSEAGR